MKKLIYFILTPLFFISGCGEFGDTNIDPKSATSAESGFLFASATKTLVDWKTTPSVNYNVMRLASQYWSQVTYTNESRYDWSGRQVADQMWLELYSRVLSDLKETRSLNAENPDEIQAANISAQISVLEVYTYQILVDAHGNVPYISALNASEDATPSYDDAEAIYADLIVQLDAAISAFDVSGSGISATQDLIYNGDLTMWVSLANSLKMRLGIRLADVDPTTAERLIIEGAAGAFSSSDFNAIMNYENDVVTGNPMYNQLVVSGRTDYVGSNTFIDILNSLEDPRRASFFRVVDGTTDYVGATYGLVAAVNYADYSNVGSMLKDPVFPGVLMCYSEVEFILAEAAERGYAVSGTAESHYNAAVTASILDWRGTATESADYLAQPSVAYSTAESGVALDAIAVQKWISFYNEADQGFAEWRRLDYPVFNAPEDMTVDDIPVRYEYPFNESSINESSYNNAVSAMGGDTQNIKLFWDVN